jgi:hypothetical protein
MDRHDVFTDPRFRPSDYLNILIRPEHKGWRYDEDDRPMVGDARHKDWLWRMAIHGQRTEPFKERFAHIYESGFFEHAEVRLSDNYILFSALPEETYVAKNPPHVATAVIRPEGESEEWINAELQKVTVGVAGQRHPDGRGSLRVVNSSHRNVHPELPFRMSPAEASAWRANLIGTLQRFDSLN